MKTRLLACLAALLPLDSLGASFTQTNGVQFHGFASQGYLLSDGNNFYGESQRGSFDFMEAGINANWNASERLNIAGQLFTRDAGTTDNGKLMVDYLFADYQMVQSQNSGLGVRLGRVRNALGFYNETRDVLFARPSIIMPQAVYFEGIGVRELLFASEGAQIYSYWDDENANTSTTFSLTMGRNNSLSETLVSNLTGEGVSLALNGRADRPAYAQLTHSLDGGRLRFALSTYDIGVDVTTRLPPPNREIRLDAQGYVASAQYNTRNWSWTAEYSTTGLTFYGGILSNVEIKVEGSYVQGQYRPHPQLTLLGRFEYTKPSGDSNADDTQRLVIGGKWTIDHNWTLAVDVHGIRGNGGIPGGDNPGGLTERTELLAVMIGYRF